MKIMKIWKMENLTETTYWNVPDIFCTFFKYNPIGQPITYRCCSIGGGVLKSYKKKKKKLVKTQTLQQNLNFSSEIDIFWYVLAYVIFPERHKSCRTFSGIKTSERSESPLI